MPTTSPAQHRLMEAAAHTPGGYGGVSQAVGKEFVGADASGPSPQEYGRQLAISGVWRSEVTSRAKAHSLWLGNNSWGDREHAQVMEAYKSQVATMKRGDTAISAHCDKLDAIDDACSRLASRMDNMERRADAESSREPNWNATSARQKERIKELRSEYNKNGLSGARLEELRRLERSHGMKRDDAASKRWIAKLSGSGRYTAIVINAPTEAEARKLAEKELGGQYDKVDYVKLDARGLRADAETIGSGSFEFACTTSEKKTPVTFVKANNKNEARTIFAKKHGVSEASVTVQRN